MDPSNFQEKAAPMGPVGDWESPYDSGCATCKKKNIACDGALPQCTNCLEQEITCPYLMMGYPEMVQMQLFRFRLNKAMKQRRHQVQGQFQGQPQYVDPAFTPVDAATSLTHVAQPTWTPQNFNFPSQPIKPGLPYTQLPMLVNVAGTYRPPQEMVPPLKNNELGENPDDCVERLYEKPKSAPRADSSGRFERRYMDGLLPANLIPIAGYHEQERTKESSSVDESSTLSD